MYASPSRRPKADLVNSSRTWLEALEPRDTWLFDLIVRLQNFRHLTSFLRSLSVYEIDGKAFRVDHRKQVSTAGGFLHFLYLSRTGKLFSSNRLMSASSLSKLGSNIVTSQAPHSFGPRMFHPRISFLLCGHSTHIDRCRSLCTIFQFLSSSPPAFQNLTDLSVLIAIAGT